MSVKRKARDFTAKWLMRVRQARAILSLGWWMVMGISTTILAWTFLSTLQTAMMLASLIGGTLLFAYLYDKTRTMKVQNRRKSWRKRNFLGPKAEMRLRYQKFTTSLLLKMFSDALEVDYEDYKKQLDMESRRLFEKWKKEGV